MEWAWKHLCNLEELLRRMYNHKRKWDVVYKQESGGEMEAKKTEIAMGIASEVTYNDWEKNGKNDK